MQGSFLLQMEFSNYLVTI